MDGSWIHDYGIVYLCFALAFAAAASVFADTHRAANRPTAAQQWTLILLVAALWPAVAIGLAQLGLVRMGARGIRAGRRVQTGGEPALTR